MKQDKPIINSLLDLDKYKLTMLSFVHAKHPDANVTYSFNNRTTSIPLAKYIDVNELKEQIQHIKTLRFTFDELFYLSGQPEFRDRSFINFLSMQKHDTEFFIGESNGQISLRFSGKWEDAILYETLVLSIINEMFARKIKDALTSTTIDDMFTFGTEALVDKLTWIKKYPGIKFIEFGTRRRHSAEWQRKVTTMCHDIAPENFIGTSNYLLAKELGLNAVGTVAHELFMVRAAIEYDLANCRPRRDTQKKTIKEWLGFNIPAMSYILTDTFGTKAFLEDFDGDLADKCYGVRHDSGDPFQFAQRMIAHYKALGIEPKHKTIVFSDGLDEGIIIKLYNTFKDEIGMTFGWGTNLTNDLGIKPLSIVVKACSVNGMETVKLSDNINKAMGNTAEVAKYINVFHPDQIEEKTIY